MLVASFANLGGILLGLVAFLSLKILSSHSVHPPPPPPPPSARGVEPATKFSKRGPLTGPQFGEGGC